MSHALLSERGRDAVLASLAALLATAGGEHLQGESPTPNVDHKLTHQTLTSDLRLQV